MTGDNRYSGLSLEWLRLHELTEGIDIPDNDNVFYWCEKLVYELADEIIFTNKNQLNYMLSYSDHSKNNVLEKSRIFKATYFRNRLL